MISGKSFGNDDAEYELTDEEAAKSAAKSAREDRDSEAHKSQRIRSRKSDSGVSSDSASNKQQDISPQGSFGRSSSIGRTGSIGRSGSAGRARSPPPRPRSPPPPVESDKPARRASNTSLESPTENPDPSQSGSFLMRPPKIIEMNSEKQHGALIKAARASMIGNNSFKDSSKEANKMKVQAARAGMIGAASFQDSARDKINDSFRNSIKGSMNDSTKDLGRVGRAKDAFGICLTP